MVVESVCGISAHTDPYTSILVHIVIRKKWASDKKAPATVQGMFIIKEFIPVPMRTRFIFLYN